MERLYRIRTPEMVEFTFPVAGLASRFLAWLVDALLIVGIGAAALFLLTLATLFSLALGPAGGLSALAVGGALGFFIFFALSWGYFVLNESLSDGRTPGKKLFRLRTISDTGVRMTLPQAAVRNLFRFLDSLPGLTYGIAAVSHAASHSGQRLGDRVAGTVVVREESRELPSRIGFPEAKYNSLLEDPISAARIARVVTAAEREVLLELLLRRDELALATRQELFAQLARHLEGRLELPRERFLSDEKLVMNVTQVLVSAARPASLAGVGERGRVGAGPRGPRA